MLTEIHDEAGPLRAPNSPFLFRHTHAAVGDTVPRLGEHTRATLREELGMSDSEIDALAESGVLGADPA